MTVAAIQIMPAFGDVEGNLAKITSILSPVDAELFVLPELVLSGYMFESAGEAASLAQEPEDGVFDVVVDVAMEKRASIVLGFAERAGGSVYNSSLLIRSDGSRAVYRKIQLFWKEKEIFAPGNRPPAVVEAGGARVGMMVCFDWVFPEIARSLALQGAEILCHPANLVLPYCQDAMVTRCIENRVFAVTSNRIGTEERFGETLTFTGQSEIVAPDGSVVSRASRDREEVLVAEIDPSQAREKTITPANDLLADRRPDLYTL